ncbi:MAG: NAD(P)-dependent oxidoreductase [bacterium]|nr:NAD(P)-dependent oxidoreductase [bacterium]
MTVESKQAMDMRLPGILVTGASGFVGRHFLEAANGKFRLFCLARRSQFEAGVPHLENQRWTQVDIAHRDALLDVARCIEEHGGADHVLHLAGYYDFTYRDHLEYERTNVVGTQNVLDLAEAIGARHFIYSSSLAACRFPAAGASLTEDSEPDADFPYARSKRDAERLIRDHPGGFRRSILRLAAIYSDWCEYPPVYAFLHTWLSDDWNSRFLGGRGKSAVPYLHIHDLTALLLRVAEVAEDLPPCSVFNASPSHATSHQDLYCAATRFLHGLECRPVHVPRALAYPAVALRQYALDLLGRPPFERTWMMRYIDRELRVDASRTQAQLGWAPTPRYDLKRRLLILVENMKSHPELWRLRNEAAIVHAARRPNLVMFSHLRQARERIVLDVTAAIRREQRDRDFRDYGRMTEASLQAYVTLFFEVLVGAMRTRDRTLVRTYARLLAYHRRRQGFAFEHVCVAVNAFRGVIRGSLVGIGDPDVTPALVNEYVDLSLQLALDEIEETYAQLEARGVGQDDRAGDVDLLANDLEMVRLVEELHDVCREGWDVDSLFCERAPDGAHGEPAGV